MIDMDTSRLLILVSQRKSQISHGRSAVLLIIWHPKLLAAKVTTRALTGKLKFGSRDSKAAAADILAGGVWVS